MTRHRTITRVALALAGWALAALPALAELPITQLNSIFPAGGRQATSVEVEITGSDLEGVDRLDFSHPGIKAEARRTPPAIPALPAQQVPNRFVVSVAADVPPGLYDVRAVGRFGISNPRTFAVSRLAELNEETTNTQFDKAMHLSLETIVNGRSGAGAIDHFRFTARKGQRVLIELWAERIDSRMDGTLSLFADAGRRELAHSRDAIGQDPLLDVVIPADGEYDLSAYDMLYQGGNDYFYRLALRTGPHVDFVFPPCGLPAAKTSATIFGRNLSGSATVSTIRFDGQPLQQAMATINFPDARQATQLDFAGYLPSRSASIDGFAYRWPSPAGPADSRWLNYASAPVEIEHEPNDTPATAQQLKLPCELAGWFSGVDDSDWLQFDARAGAVYRMEVVSQRRGESSDPYLLVERVTRDAQGKEQVTDVGEVDDEPTKNQLPGFSIASADPIYRFTAPADGTYRVLVRDLAPSVAPHPYTLAIREPRPDFRLVAVPIYPSSGKKVEIQPWSLLLRRGGTAMLEVVALPRDGFDGAIDVSATGLPKGIKARPVVIGPGQTTAYMVFESTADQPTWAGTIELLGTGHVDGKTITRHARSGTVLWPPPNTKKTSPLVPGRMAHTIALSATADESLPVKIELGESFDMSRAGKLQIPVKVVRSDFKDALTLTSLGLPATLKAAPLTIAAGKNEGQLVIDVAAGAVPAEYSLVLHAEAKINYRRDEGGLRVANELHAKLEKIEAELAAASRVATASSKKQAEANAKAAAAAEDAAFKRAAEAVFAAKPKPLTVTLYSPPARLKITAAPVELSIKDPPPVARPGELKVPVALLRRYNYAEQLVLEPVATPQLPDLKISAPAIAAGKAEGQLQITVGPKTPPGTHRLTVRAKPTFNKQVLAVETTFTLTIK